MTIKLQPTQISFILKTKSELDEAISTVTREQQAIQDIINTSHLIRQHMEVATHAGSRRDAKKESLDDYIASLGYAGGKLDWQDGQPVIVIPDSPTPAQEGV